MKKFSLLKKTADVYAFSALLLLTSSILVWTDVYNKPTGTLVADVYVQGVKIDSLPLDVDTSVTYLQSDYPVFKGDITVEITDGKVRVEKETSPLHYCSIQGWVGDAGMPIICAPNYFMVVIEGAA
ncbi:MAG: NusG domain II-containing protein [Firmicutes bacterium]|nr:NusG domain II-containing protein [Bacillota bacterium]